MPLWVLGAANLVYLLARPQRLWTSRPVVLVLATMAFISLWHTLRTTMPAMTGRSATYPFGDLMRGLARLRGDWPAMAAGRSSRRRSILSGLRAGNADAKPAAADRPHPPAAAACRAVLAVRRRYGCRPGCDGHGEGHRWPSTTTPTSPMSRRVASSSRPRRRGTGDWSAGGAGRTGGSTISSSGGSGRWRTACGRVPRPARAPAAGRTTDSPRPSARVIASSPLLADATYLALKPLEWAAACCACGVRRP